MSTTEKHTETLEMLNALINGIGGIDSKIIELVHTSHFLVDDLEAGFDFGRGENHGAGGIRLVFQKDGIDATLWLMAKLYGDIRDLQEVITKARVAVDELELGFPGGILPVVGKAAA